MRFENMSLYLPKVVQKSKASRTLRFVSYNNPAVHYGPVFLFLGAVRHDLQKGVEWGWGREKVCSNNNLLSCLKDKAT
jgi:hypothetical protein